MDSHQISAVSLKEQWMGKQEGGQKQKVKCYPYF